MSQRYHEAREDTPRIPLIPLHAQPRPIPPEFSLLFLSPFHFPLSFPFPSLSSPLSFPLFFPFARASAGWQTLCAIGKEQAVLQLSVAVRQGVPSMCRDTGGGFLEGGRAVAVAP